MGGRRLIAGDISDVAEGNGVLTVYDKSNSLKVGDTIRLEQTELTVAGVLEDSPFDTTDQPIVICSERMFTDITGEDAYAVLDVQLSSKASEQNVNELHALSDGHYDFYDRMAQNKDTQNTYFMFCLFVYGFLAVITLNYCYSHCKQYFHECICKNKTIRSHARGGNG